MISPSLSFTLSKNLRQAERIARNADESSLFVSIDEISFVKKERISITERTLFRDLK